MTKNMTHKSLAIGAGFALMFSGLAAMPASADNNGPITLLPDGSTAAGATFTTISTAALTLDAVLNPSLNTGTSLSADESNATDRALYIIDNPAGAELDLNLDGAAGEPGYILYNEDGEASAELNADTTATNLAVTSGGTTITTIAVANKATATGTYVDVNGGSGGDTDNQNILTNATKIAIKAGLNAGASGEGIRSLSIDLGAGKDADTTVTLSVQVVTDTTFNSTNEGIINAFEHVSAKETVTIVPLSAATATTTLTAIDRTTGNSATSGDVAGRIVMGGGINPHAVQSSLRYTLFKDGTAVTLERDANTNGNQGTVQNTDSVATNGSVPFDGMQESTTTAGLARAFEAGSYSVQAYFNNGTDNIAIGAPSAVVNLTDGLVSGIDNANAFLTETANIDWSDTGEASTTIRTGTNSVTVQAEARSDSTTRIKSSGIEFKVSATANKLSATSSVSMSGTTATLDAKDDTAVATAVSGSNGLVDIVVTNSGAAKGDSVTLVFEAKKDDGTYATSDTVTLVWADAALTSFKAVNAYVSGANPTVTFKAQDQFGAPVNSTTTGQLSVTVVADIGGVDDTSLLSETKTLVDGEVSFTFANFATGAGQARVEAELFEGRTKVATSDLTSPNNVNPLFVTVYDTEGVDSVTVLDSYSTDITYADYVVGDETDAAVAKSLADTSFTSEPSVDITGSVLDENSVGQPGAEVVVAGEGLLFYDSQLGIYAEDTITIYANEFGAYDVTVRAHEQNAVGIPVTITSGSVTADTLVKTYFPQNELDRDTLVFSWNLPEVMVMNTTYAVTAKLTDRWGNPVDTANGTNSVTFDGNGSIQVNGIANATNKDFNADGEVTVFLRSIKDIAGPGEVTATLNSVANQYSVAPSGGTPQTDQFGTLSPTRTTDVDTTVWDETLFDSTLTAEFDVKETAAEAAAADAKVNAGSFKGYVAVYAKGYEGSRLSAKIGNDWVVVPALASNFERIVDFTGAGVDIAVRIYIDRVLMDTINLTTK